jgi:hypothetical protein
MLGARLGGRSGLLTVCSSLLYIILVIPNSRTFFMYPSIIAIETSKFY